MNSTDAMTSLPFFPVELVGAVGEISGRYGMAGAQMLAGEEELAIDTDSCRLCGEIRLTYEEIRILQNLAEGKAMDLRKKEPYINSLNNKLESLNKKSRIRYIISEGYRLVMNHG